MAMYAMIKGLHEAGKTVHLLAMNTSRHRVEQAKLPALFTEIASCTLVATDTEIRIIPTLANLLLSRKPQHANRFYSKKFEQKLLETIHAIQPDVIQMESIYLHEYVAAIRRHSNALIVQRLHNIEAEIWQRLAGESKKTFEKLYLQNLSKRIASYEQKVWKESDALIPISNTDAACIKNSGVDTPLCTIPYGIDISEATERKASGSGAYHIGAMDWQPNIEAMQWMQEEIVPAVCKMLPEFSFEFAGRNMPEQFLKEKKASFHCAGEVADAEKFIASKNILIVPLRSGSGIRIKTLEAMAAGKLVISTRIGIQGIDALDKIHFLEADTPEAFANALVWCTHNPDAALRIAQNAFDLLLSNHNQKKLMQTLHEFVEKLP